MNLKKAFFIVSDVLGAKTTSLVPEAILSEPNQPCSPTCSSFISFVFLLAQSLVNCVTKALYFSTDKLPTISKLSGSLRS